MPRLLRSLAMTDVVVGLRLDFGFPCHCEEAAGRRGNPYPNRVIARSEATWQSRGSIVRLQCSVNRYQEIATAPLGPRNDKHGSACPQPCHCEEAKPTWQSRGNIVRLQCSVNRCQEIATASSKPRNDIRCTIVPLKSVPEGDTSILHSSFFILHFI